MSKTITTAAEKQEQFDAMKDAIIDQEWEADAQADRCEAEFGEFSRSHVYWLDIRLALRNVIDLMNKCQGCK